MDYPSYNSIEQYISSNPKCFFEFMEYSNTNHKRMQRVHIALSSDDTDDVIKDIIRDIGEEIYATGGMDALRGCFFAFIVAYRVILKDKRSNKLQRQYQGHIYLLEQYLEGIGDWKT